MALRSDAGEAYLKSRKCRLDWQNKVHFNLQASKQVACFEALWCTGPELVGQEGRRIPRIDGGLAKGLESAKKADPDVMNLQLNKRFPRKMIQGLLALFF